LYSSLFHTADHMRTFGATGGKAAFGTRK